MKTNLLVVLISILFFSCEEKEYYSPTQINILKSIVEDDSLTIYYKAPLETMYFSSGVDYSYSNDFKTVELKFIREKIGNDTERVLAKSFLVKNEFRFKQKYKEIDVYAFRLKNDLNVTEADIEKSILVK